ncbi:MAG TPA: serine hydrolase [Candidatus Eisenbacteria bacterium]|jgi:D-alanyl-D-alanine carboxypeptidase|nr:serine hydrolase [Candidatus Eisenbacteria bacterium]
MARRLLSAALVLAAVSSAAVPAGEASGRLQLPALTARSAIVVDAANGGVLFSKNPFLRLPPASTAKVMTVLLAVERLTPYRTVRISRNAAAASPSKAGLTVGAEYKAWDLIVAALVASSNDAAVALAEAVSGSEPEFAKLMNRRAEELGMRNTRFVNATGLTDKRRTQYSTAYDLTLLMRRAARDRRLDEAMGLLAWSFSGSDGRVIEVKSHNKMLWRTPKFVKGKTGWTFASRHTFVGTDYSPYKKIHFAMLSSTEPWDDIEELANFGLRQKAAHA